MRQNDTVPPQTLLVTGGLGFIGSAFVRRALARGYRVVNLDAMTYAACPKEARDFDRSEHYTFIHGTIQDRPLAARILKEYRPTWVINFAAETHVDRSIDAPQAFVDTNITGTFALLDEALAFYRTLSLEARQTFRFLHISTDEVFGSAETRPFHEQDPYKPSSPYAASKAASDHLVHAYHKTYGLPVLLTHCTNNYGPYQFPEKLIPHMIMCALEEKPLPLYGDGMQKRDWLHVEDHVDAIMMVLERGVIGESYNISGPDGSVPNIQIVRAICQVLDPLKPRSRGQSYSDLIAYVQDRPGHDRCYALDASKIRTTLGWSPRHHLQEGLEKTVAWYVENPWFQSAVLKNGYEPKRVGLEGSHEA